LRCADRRLPPQPVRAKFFHAAPDHLAAIQPRLGTRLTARCQLQPPRSRLHRAFRLMDTGHPPRGGATPAWRCRPRAGLCDRPLTFPVAPPSARCDPSAREEPESLPPSPRQWGRLSRPRTSFLDKCSREDPLSRTFWLVGARHRSRGFATDDPASDARSPHPALSRRRARPVLVIQRLFVPGREGPRAACRLLQSIRSASTTSDCRTPHDLASGRPPEQPVS